MNRPTNDWSRITEGIRYFEVFSKASVPQIISYVAIAFALYISAGSAYILGVLAGLPAVIITSANHATIVYLLGQLTFMLVIAFSLFKVSQLIVNAMFIQLNFCICKIHAGSKRPRGLRHPTVARLQRRMNNAVVEGRRYAMPIFLIRISITVLFLVLVFFPIENGAIITTPTRSIAFFVFFFGGFIAITGSMSAYRVAAGQTHREFFASSEGRKFGVVVVLWICMALGVARSTSMMHGPVVHFSFGGMVCELAPMMPILGGNLYFDRVSRTFVVLSGGKISFYVPHLASQKEPACI